MVYPHHTSRHLHLKVIESSKGQGQNHYNHSWNKSRAGAQEKLLRVTLQVGDTEQKIPAFGEQFGGTHVYVCVLFQALSCQ